ncbi:MAG: LAGLIDADG family homing endonuclease [Candidatus Woesearchaeota archaeon]
MGVTAAQKFKLKNLIKELEQYRGRHTELVSVYIPVGYDLNKILNHLNEEQGTANNIKSASTRKNVIDALERMIQHLKLYPKTPDHGLAVFSGNIASREGQNDVKVWSVEPPLPVQFRIYRCDKEFLLDPLREMCEDKDIYGLVVIDRRDANIALLKGKTIVPLLSTHSEVPGKTRAGGQCLLPESIVQLSDGCLPEMRKVHNPHRVKSIVMDKYSINDSDIIDKWDTNKNVVYKIITKNPRLEVSSSNDHVFFAVGDEGIIEKKADELREGDSLIMPERIDIAGKTQQILSSEYYNSFRLNKAGRELLKRKRLEKGLHQKELAKRLNMTQTAISLVELGKRNINRSFLRGLCCELGLDFQEFLGGYTRHFSRYGKVSLPERLDPEFAMFLGYTVGDGHIEKDRIILFEQDERVALDYKSTFDKYFNLNSTYRLRRSKNYHQVKFTSRPLVRLIREVFHEIKKSQDTVIPSLILKSDNKVVASFLRGLFDAEGYISGSKAGMGMNNKQLIQQVQMALLRFSILSSFLEYDNRANKYSNTSRFTIEISEKESLRRFRRLINFTSKKKSAGLDDIIDRKSDMSRNRQIMVPGAEIRNIIEKAGYNLELFPKVNNFFINKRMISKQAFKNSVLGNIKNKKLHDKLKEVYQIPILPVKINRIDIKKKNVPMVDISVKDRNFIANGLIVHNSAHRYEMNRELAAKAHFRKVAEYMKEQFLEDPDIKGIIVGGPGPTKHDFLAKGQITDQLKRKVIAVKDLSYTGDFGLQELVDKSQDVLADEEIAAEKQVMGRFFEALAKNPSLVAYGFDDVKKKLEMGAVEVLLLSEALDDKVIEEMENIAKQFNTEVSIVSTETREGVQLRDIGKIAGILRYEVHE